MQKTTQVLWLRNDLRLHDHEGFRLAVEDGAPLAVVYILPEHWLTTDDDGMSRLGSAKAHFLRASLIDLHRQLEDQTINFMYKLTTKTSEQNNFNKMMIPIQTYSDPYMIFYFQNMLRLMAILFL